MIRYPVQFGAETGLIPQSDFICVVKLDPNAEETFAVPEGAAAMLFSATTDFYCRVNAAAAVPSADVTDGSASELNPTMRRVKTGDVWHFISPYVCTITLSLYG